LIVVHTTQGGGNDTYRSLGNYFANSASGVSSHTGIDDTPGAIGEYVKRDKKAWTQANANPYSVAAELCAMAEWAPADWDRHPTMLENCATWIAEEAAAFGIPIRKLSASEAQGGAAGVCGHVDLGASGGGHWDPGPNFPWSRVMSMAQQGPPQPVVPKKPKVIHGKDGEDVTSLEDETFLHVWGMIGNQPYHWWQFLPGKGNNPKTNWFVEALPTS
jgi:hypothetical protein